MLLHLVYRHIAMVPAMRDHSAPLNRAKAAALVVLRPYLTAALPSCVLATSR